MESARGRWTLRESELVPSSGATPTGGPRAIGGLGEKGKGGVLGLGWERRWLDGRGFLGRGKEGMTEKGEREKWAGWAERV